MRCQGRLSEYTCFSRPEAMSAGYSRAVSHSGGSTGAGDVVQ